ncbi:AcrR family transcriptional regulator [Sedimentibacter acidaminivorans]|jgi:AcrR family transcriptional regulator|uniref:AcrR family transcriptional regulator n=1 Tax=Sedimentibacter acidaminivorans TaxID=913099 RepID=A0ABS4GF62_9FIRM|nr:TetR/AcrR family transcriptional regulator [Sedimentibacter acidaminivorans]MBP1926010.1 AcrR family transcriptional regulator [Sedimentibacter acidaminivorans]
MDEFIDIPNSKLSEKEKLILKAACETFSEKGYNATSTKEIAKMAGVSEGTIFRYFKTKNHILKGLLVQLIELVVENIALPPIEKILQNETNKDDKEIFKEIIIDRMNLVNNNFKLFKVIVSEALFQEDIRGVVYNKLISRATFIIDDYYEKMVRNGTARQLPSKIVFSSIVGSIFMFILKRNMDSLYSNVEQDDNIDKDIDFLIDIMFNGIGSK